MKYLSILFILLALMLCSAYSQNSKEQQIGKPKKKSAQDFKLKGSVKAKETGQAVPNADIEVKELNQQKVIQQTQTNATGDYEVTIPKGVDVEVKASSRELFYDAFKVKVRLEDSTNIIQHDFLLTSELQLRLNFPTNEYDNPYPFVVDESGNMTNQTWQDAINSLAEDLKKYKNYLEKVNLIGHTDDVGTDDYNNKLGMNRVQFVQNELVKRGVDKELISASSSGKKELLPQLPGEDKESWRKRCRRVQLSKLMKK